MSAYFRSSLYNLNKPCNIIDTHIQQILIDMLMCANKYKFVEHVIIFSGHLTICLIYFI